MHSGSYVSSTALDVVKYLEALASSCQGWNYLKMVMHAHTTVQKLPYSSYPSPVDNAGPVEDWLSPTSANVAHQQHLDPEPKNGLSSNAH